MNPFSNALVALGGGLGAIGENYWNSISNQNQATAMNRQCGPTMGLAYQNAATELLNWQMARLQSCDPSKPDRFRGSRYDDGAARRFPRPVEV